MYTSFVTKGQKSSKWAHQHLLNFKALSRAVSIRSQLRRYLERYNLFINSCKDAANPSECIRKCILSGYFPNVAKMQPDGTYRLVKGDIELYVHPSSVMFNRKAKWVMFHEVVETSNKTFMRDVTTIEREWLTELAYVTSFRLLLIADRTITRSRRRNIILIGTERLSGWRGVGAG